MYISAFSAQIYTLFSNHHIGIEPCDDYIVNFLEYKFTMLIYPHSVLRIKQVIFPVKLAAKEKHTKKLNLHKRAEYPGQKVHSLHIARQVERNTTNMLR